MSIQVGDVLRVVAVLRWLDGDIAQNVFNAVVGGTGGPYDDADIVDDALTWVGDMYGELVTSMSDEIDGSEIRVYLYDFTDADWDEVGSDAWTFNPSGAAEQLPRGVAELINVKTLDPDVNGKKYVPGAIESLVDDGLLNSAEIARLALFATEWAEVFTGGTSGAMWVPGIWSPTRANFYPMSGTIIIPTICAYQRRRKRGIGI